MEQVDYILVIVCLVLSLFCLSVSVVYHKKERKKIGKIVRGGIMYFIIAIALIVKYVFYR